MATISGLDKSKGLQWATKDDIKPPETTEHEEETTNPTKQSFADKCGISHVNWFPGHMKKAIGILTSQVQKCKVVIDVRDARIPLSSNNPLLDEVTKHKKRVIVLNKADLADKQATKRLEKYIAEKEGDNVVMVRVISCKDSSSINRLIQDVARLTKPKFKTLPTGVLVVGFPNVGKSSLLNTFRHRAKQRSVAKVGALPGVTRKVKGILVSVDPPLFVIDTPGVMVPSFERTDEGLECGVKLAATGAIKESLVGQRQLARYLLGRFLEMEPTGGKWRSALRVPSDLHDPDQIFEKMASRVRIQSSAMDQEEEAEARVAAKLLNLFRKGDLGRFTLDRIP